MKTGTTLYLRGHPILGDVNASVVIVEFGDYECTHCIRYGKEILPFLRQKFIDQGIIRYAYMNSPLPVHRNAMLLACAAICAGEQKDYWVMHDALIEKQPSTRLEVMKVAESLGLDLLEFDTCLSNVTSENQINEDLQQAKNLGLRAVPSFAVGTIKPDGQVLVQELITGAQPFRIFEHAIGKIHVH
jgi:protein-disulfide isomerase